MIRLIDNREEIIPLWQEAFGDSEDEIRYFLDNARHAQCVGYYAESELASMLFAVDCTLKQRTFYYIYAACTEQKHKNNGYMTALLEFCIQRYERLCLIPANDGLIDYYKNRGFAHCAPIDGLAFDESVEIQEYLLDGYRLTEPKALWLERN